MQENSQKKYKNDTIFTFFLIAIMFYSHKFYIFAKNFTNIVIEIRANMKENYKFKIFRLIADRWQDSTGDSGLLIDFCNKYD